MVILITNVQFVNTYLDDKKIVALCVLQSMQIVLAQYLQPSEGELIECDK